MFYSIWWTINWSPTTCTTTIARLCPVASIIGSGSTKAIPSSCTKNYCFITKASTVHYIPAKTDSDSSQGCSISTEVHKKACCTSTVSTRSWRNFIPSNTFAKTYNSSYQACHSKGVSKTIRSWIGNYSIAKNARKTSR